MSANQRKALALAREVFPGHDVKVRTRMRCPVHRVETPGGTRWKKDRRFIDLGAELVVDGELYGWMTGSTERVAWREMLKYLTWLRRRGV